ncbi:MAG: type I methionyl aminopeptidase [Patescibacteria group bacterium]|nr:MAG: type I methionyl aminopeptidase [Patescibacteria group bacterium]
MAIQHYTDEDIAKLREGGRLLSEILGELARMAKPGVTTAELDAHAEKRMRDAGGEPSFKGYKAGGAVPFNGTVCTSINDEVVHAPPHPGRALEEGMLLSLDIGLRYKGLCTDMAVTLPIGEVPESWQKLVRVTKESLLAGIDVIRPGVKIREVGRAVQPVVERAGFGVVRALVGHGVGRHVHEEPNVPNYDDPDMPAVTIKKGMVLAVEPMVTMGSWDVLLARDQWTIKTIDKKPAAHWEVTVAVTDDGYEILTPLPI